MSDTELKGLINNVVTTIDRLISSAIANAKNDDMDSMGTYYEEIALKDSITELVECIMKREKE